MKHYNNLKSQAGMTLIELTVVLLVLIGLAGLLIPYVSGFISRTHDSTGTSNLAELNNTIQRFQVQYNSLPDDLHSLVDINGAVYSELMNPTFLTAKTYTADAAAGMVEAETPLASLVNAGITSIYNMKDPAGNGSKTFDAGNTSVAVPNPMMGTAGTVDVAVLGAGDKGSIEGHLAYAFGNQVDAYDASCYDYVVMGIGQESEMTGRTMSDAPVHFAQNGDMGPDKKYNRFVAVFQVDKTMTSVVGVAGTNKGCAAGTEQAKFIGTAMNMMPAHLTGLNAELGSAYSNMAAK